LRLRKPAAFCSMPHLYRLGVASGPVAHLAASVMSGSISSQVRQTSLVRPLSKIGLRRTRHLGQRLVSTVASQNYQYGELQQTDCASRG
jgi:hypothetical protein